MKILKIEPLVWKFYDGVEPCFVCHENGSVATWKAQLEHRDMIVNLLICDGCKGLEAAEMLARVI